MRASSCSRTPSSYLSGPSTSSPKVRGRGKEMLQIQIDSKSLIDQLSVCIAKQVIRALELFRVFFNEQIRDGHMDPCSRSYPLPPEYPCFSYTKKLMKMCCSIEWNKVTCSILGWVRHYITCLSCMVKKWQALEKMVFQMEHPGPGPYLDLIFFLLFSYTFGKVRTANFVMRVQNLNG